MTTEKARKLLGKDYEHRSDQEIDALVNKMDLLADVLADAVIDRLGENKDNEECDHTNQSLIVQTSD